MKKRHTEYGIFSGGWTSWKKGKSTFGTLHLNKVVREVLRACGYPCINCLDDNCTEPMVKLLSGIPVAYTNAAGVKTEASTLSLPTYADDVAAAADNFPINGLYYDTSGILRRRVA